MSLPKKLLAKMQEHPELFREHGFHLHPDHSLPTTRRQLLASGFYAGFYGLTMPAIGSILLSAKEAQANPNACPSIKSLLGVPFAQFNFSGGRRLWSDIALGLSRDGAPEEYKPADAAANENDFANYGLLADYHPMKGGAMNEYRMLGGHPFQPISYMFQSARQVFGDQFSSIDEKLTIISFATKLPDDSSAVTQAMGACVAKFRGSSDFTLSSNTAGTNLNGINAVPAFTTYERATVVGNNDISELLKTGLGSADSNLKNRYMDTLYALLQSQVASDAGRRIFGCSTDAVKKKLAAFSQAMNPFTMNQDNLDRELASHFADQNNRTAVLSWMLAKGYASTIAINAGGYDYHNGTSDGYLRDFSAFQNNVWPMVRYFHSIGQPLIIFLTSDGSTRSEPGAVDPRTTTFDGNQVSIGHAKNIGDAGGNGGAMMIVYSPNGRLEKSPQRRGLGNQIGHGTPQGVAGNPSNPIGNADSNSYQQVVLENIRRIMVVLSGADVAATFQEAAGGIRFSGALEKYIVA